MKLSIPLAKAGTAKDIPFHGSIILPSEHYPLPLAFRQRIRDEGYPFSAEYYPLLPSTQDL